MECKVCGQRHMADIKPNSGGHYRKSSWQCIHGCELEDSKKGEKNDEINA